MDISCSFIGISNMSLVGLEKSKSKGGAVKPDSLTDNVDE
jgi:hypothetical protein